VVLVDTPMVSRSPSPTQAKTVVVATMDSFTLEVTDSLCVEVASTVSISVESVVQDPHPDELREELGALELALFQLRK
jgi:hypothetical protein